ncbi:MAG: hypothetical protein ACRD2H_02890 [Terriglobales bacterium]
MSATRTLLETPQRGAAARAAAAPVRMPRMFTPRLYRRMQNGLGGSGAGRWLGFHVHVYIAAERDSLRHPARPPRELRLGQETEAALPALAAVRPEPPERLRARFAAGHWCFAAWRADRCVAYLWAAPGPTELTSQFGCSWRVPAGVVWIYDLFTVAGVIGAFGHLNQALWKGMGERLHLIAGQVELDNHASRAAHASLGFRELGVIWSWRVGPWRWHCLCAQQPRRRCWRWGLAAVAPYDWMPVERGH